MPLSNLPVLRLRETLGVARRTLNGSLVGGFIHLIFFDAGKSILYVIPSNSQRDLKTFFKCFQHHLIFSRMLPSYIFGSCWTWLTKLIKLGDVLVFVSTAKSVSEQRRHESDAEMEATGNAFKATLKGFTVGKGSHVSARCF